MRPVPLMLTGGLTALAVAYLSPLIADPELHAWAMALGITSALIGVDGWRRTRTWNPGDYA